MADEKPASGGGMSSWTAAEIILGIILLIALLSKIFGTPITPITQVPDVAGGNAPIVTQTQQNQCALFINRPKPLGEVTSFVTVTGTATGCSWTSQYPALVFAQILDANGIAVSDTVSVPAVKNSASRASFSTTVNIIGVPVTKTGYAQITMTDATARDHQTIVRIPITFAN